MPTTTKLIRAEDGGIIPLEIDNGMIELEIYPDSLISDQEITISTLDESPTNRIADLLFSGVEFTPTSLNLAQNGKFTFHPALELTEPEAVACFYVRTDGLLEFLKIVEATQVSVCCEITHFSKLGVGKPTPLEIQTFYNELLDFLQRTTQTFEICDVINIIFEFSQSLKLRLSELEYENLMTTIIAKFENEKEYILQNKPDNPCTFYIKAFNIYRQALHYILAKIWSGFDMTAPDIHDEVALREFETRVEAYEIELNSFWTPERKMFNEKIFWDILEECWEDPLKDTKWHIQLKAFGECCNRGHFQEHYIEGEIQFVKNPEENGYKIVGNGTHSVQWDITACGELKRLRLYFSDEGDTYKPLHTDGVKSKPCTFGGTAKMGLILILGYGISDPGFGGPIEHMIESTNRYGGVHNHPHPHIIGAYAGLVQWKTMHYKPPNSFKSKYIRALILSLWHKRKYSLEFIAGQQTINSSNTDQLKGWVESVIKFSENTRSWNVCEDLFVEETITIEKIS